jgi:hypothetical protein
MACRLPRNVCTYLPDYTASHPATRAILYVCDVAVFDWFCHVATLFLSAQRLELAIYCVQIISISSTHFCSYRLYRHSSVRLSPFLPPSDLSPDIPPTVRSARLLFFYCSLRYLFLFQMNVSRLSYSIVTCCRPDLPAICH